MNPDYPNLGGTPWAWAALDTDARERLNARAGALGCTVAAVVSRRHCRAGAEGPLGRTDVFAKPVATAMGLALDAYEDLIRKNIRIGEIAASVDYCTPDELEAIYEASR